MTKQCYLVCRRLFENQTILHAGMLQRKSAECWLSRGSIGRIPSINDLIRRRGTAFLERAVGGLTGGVTLPLFCGGDNGPPVF